VLALWRFFAGDSRVAPLGIALALLLATLGTRLAWGAGITAAAFVATLVATLYLAARER
jgi:hypothetical protein